MANNIFLLFGEEKYDLNLKVEKIKKEFDMLEVGVNLFYLNSENYNNLKSIIESVTFFGEEKLIIIKDTKLKFDIDVLEENISDKIKIIIIEESVDKRTSEYKKLCKIAECIEFSYLDEKQMTSYIIQILKKYSVNISNEVSIYMLNVCGNDKTNIINELQKIVTYLDKNDTVTHEIIDKICSKTLNAKIFDLLDKIVDKDTKNVGYILDDILKQKESIIKIYIMLYKQIKQMYMIKIMKEKKEDNIAQKLEIHPFVFNKLSKSSEKYKTRDLLDLIYIFDEYDEKNKNGEIDFEIGLKKIIYSM